MTNYELMQLDAEWWLAETDEELAAICSAGWMLRPTERLLIEWAETYCTGSFDTTSWLALLISEAEKDEE